MKNIALFFLILMIFSGCKVGPVYEEPQIEMACDWESDLPPHLSGECSETLNWWENFNDPTLNQLMNLALEQNLDLKIAALRVLQARAEANAKKGDLYPRLDGSASYGHVYYSKDALVNGLLGTALPVDSNHVRRNVNFYEVGFDAEWELDFFGLTAHEIAALKAHEEGVQETLCGVWLTLTAEIAKNYFEYRLTDERVILIQQRIDHQSQGFELSQDLLARGFLNDSDLLQIQSDMNTLKGEFEIVSFEKIKIEHRLAVLLGYSPGELRAYLECSNGLPGIPVHACVGLPSDLLRRRPDIKKAERELAAATERIGSAIASLFPRFTLRGFVGDISTHAGSLFNPASATWFAGPQLLLPIFNSRLILQEIEYNKMVTTEALYNYQKTVLEALEEAENAIANFIATEKKFVHLEAAADQQQNKELISKDLFDRGVIDSFELMKNQDLAISVYENKLQARVQLLNAYIAVYKSIGG